MQIIASISKKRPGPIDYSSIQASVSISREIAHGEDILTAAAELQAQAEAAVDQQLARGSVPISQSHQLAPHVASQNANGSHPATTPSAAQARPATSPPPQKASQPYRGNAQRRGPAPVTDSQLRFLKRLLDQTKTSLPAVLEHHQVGGLDQLTCKAAAELIDELKTRVPA